jgi:hypothetical protein
MSAIIHLDEATARRILATVDAGLSHGLGAPHPGHMCVEAAVCFALDLPHSDDPKCVAQSLRKLKIALNDLAWPSPAERAKALRRLAIAQLGTNKDLDELEFTKRVLDLINTTILPIEKAYFDTHHDTWWQPFVTDWAKDIALDIDEGFFDDSHGGALGDIVGKSVRYTDYDFAHVAQFCEGVVQILIAMGAKGTEWLHLTEAH